MPAGTPGRQFIDVLVVDDMENVHKKLRSLLPDTVTLNGCVSARDALQHCQERVFRVVLVDLVIPDVNSVALMNQLRVLQPHAVMVALALRTANDIAGECRSQGFHDVMLKPFDAAAVDEWRAKYFEVKDILSVDDNVLSCGEFTGKQDKVDGYFQRLKNMCHDSFEKLASACYEDTILDLSRVPLHNEKLPRLVMEMDSQAKKFGIMLRLVGNPDAQKALSALVETASLPFFTSISDAKNAAA
ncbi:MAG: response regulator [Proteobacteria bacterium]|nr:response regulator [Pseudomonadota bacterium]